MFRKIIGLLLCVTLSLCLALPGCAEVNSLQEGDFTLFLADGTQFTLSDHLGKVVLVNFWATWCGPCVYEMPALNDLAAHYAGAEDVVIVAVNCGDALTTVKQFLEQKGFGSLTAACDMTTEVSCQYEVDAIPTTLLFDRTGALNTRYLGVPMDVELLCAHYIELIEALR